MSKKLFAFALITIVTMSTLTACGNAAATTSAPAAEAVESEGEGPVQGGIKSDEEIAALQAEEAQYADEAPAEESTTEYAENIDNTGHEPEAYGSGNFQDYWQGENYFDLEGYLKANGCDYLAPTNGEDHKKVENGAKAYFTYFNNNTWEIYIYPSSGCTLIYQIPDETNHLQGYIVYDELALDQVMVTVNDQGTQISKGIIVVLDTIVSALKQYPNDLDPMQYFDIRYASYTQ